MTATLICNLALSQVPAAGIVNLDEASVQARYCKLWYPQVVSELLTKSTWRFSTVRVALAAIETDRMGEWVYAYSIPSNMALPIRVLDAGGGTLAHEYTGTTIYAGGPDAILEYVTTADMTSSYDGLFRAALLALLASRLCMPITKNQKRELVLAQAAEIAIQRAVAFNINLGQPQYMNHTPDTLAARNGDIPLRRVYEGPEATYPDFDPVGTFESELD